MNEPFAKLSVHVKDNFIEPVGAHAKFELRVEFVNGNYWVRRMRAKLALDWLAALQYVARNYPAVDAVLELEKMRRRRE